MKTAIYEFMGRHRKLTYRMEPPESSRVYIYPGGDRVEIENVVKAVASRHGNHELTTDDGTVHIQPWGWINLHFPAPSKVVPAEVAARGEARS